MPDGYSGILISLNDNKRLNEISLIVSSLIVDSFIVDSSIVNSSIVDSSIVDSSIVNSFIVNSLIVDSSIVNSLIVNSETANYQTTELSNYQTTELSNYKTTELSNYETTKLSNYKTTKLSNYKTEYEVLSWHFTMEKLLQTAKSDKAMGMIIMYILYLIVGFGILGTVIMMTTERKREFCVMISLGMSRMKLAIITACELFVMSILGLLAAFVITLPAAFWFKTHPIQLPADMASMMTEYGIEPYLYMSVEPNIFTSQLEIILVIILIATIYPLRKIMKLKIANN